MSYQAVEHRDHAKSPRQDARSRVAKQQVEEVRPGLRAYSSSVLVPREPPCPQNQETQKQGRSPVQDIEKITELLDRVNKKLVDITPNSDQTIKTQYSDLCNMVEDWVNKNCDDAESLCRGSADGIEASSTQKQSVDALLDNGAVLEVKDANADAEFCMPMRVMMRFLFETMLRRTRWHPGVALEQEKILNTTLYHLYNSYPARDKSPHVHMLPNSPWAGSMWRESWKCHTYQSLRTSPDVQAVGRRRLEMFIKELSDIMTVFVKRDQAVNEDSLEVIVLAPAVLADMIRSCPFHHVSASFAPQMPAALRTLGKKTIENNVVVDISTGVSLGDDVLFGSLDENRAQGEVVGTIFPSLFKITQESAAINIARGMILVKMTQKIALRKQIDGQTLPVNQQIAKDVSERSSTATAKQWSSLLK